jgi:PAS domain S-box-containing protein
MLDPAHRNIGPKLLSMIIFLFCLIVAYPQQVTDDQIKAGYIYNFLKYIQWENEEKTDTFKIAIYGEDYALINNVKSIEKLQVKGKPIRVISFKSIGDLEYTHILMITNDRNFFVKDILDLIKGRNTLLVTDRCEYQRYVMINFIYNADSKIQFEINSQNMEEARLKSSSRLILLGGSEIDVRRLYLETEKSLITEKGKVSTYEKELALKKEEIQNMNTKLHQLYKEIGTLQGKISVQKTDLLNLTHQSEEQQKDLYAKSLILFNQKNEIENRERQLVKRDSEIYLKQLKIEDYSQVLNSQKTEIQKRQATIEKQRSTMDQQGKLLNSQGEQIRTQRNFLYMLVALVITAFTLIFVIYRNFIINRQRNRELEKLSIVARETDNAVVIADENGDFEWINEGFTRMYGYEFDELLQTRGKNLLEASSYKYIETELNIISQEKRSVTYESSIQSKEGKIVWVHSTITPILDGDKNIKKLIIIDSDITPLKEAELAILEKNEEIQRQSEELYEQTEQLLALNQELEQKKNVLEEALTKLKNTQTQLVESEKMIILGQLTAGIAHEINNPINFINSGIEGIKMAFEQIFALLKKYEEITASNAKEQLKSINEYKQEIDYSNLLVDIEKLTHDVKSGIYRTVEIVKGLRTFTRLDESDLKYIDLHKSINSTLIILRNKFDNKIKIIKDYGNIPEIECYPGKVNQVLLNLLVNAVQAIKGVGQITIKTQLKKKEDQQFVEILVKDTGTGMTKETQKRIFEPFFTTKDAGEGTGLGLSITRNIIDIHHGSIEVESELGEGSVFTILLPVNFNKKDLEPSIIELNTNKTNIR